MFNRRRQVSQAGGWATRKAPDLDGLPFCQIRLFKAEGGHSLEFQYPGKDDEWSTEHVIVPESDNPAALAESITKTLITIALKRRV